MVSTCKLTWENEGGIQIKNSMMVSDKYFWTYKNVSSL